MLYRSRLSRRLAVVAPLLVVLGGCGGDSPNSPAHGPSPNVPVVARIEISPDAPSLLETVSLQLTATPWTADGARSGAAVVWRSMDTTIAYIEAAGLVHAQRFGTAEIRATSGSVSASVQLVVSKATVKRIVITPVAVDMQAGDTVRISVTPFDERGVPLRGRTPTFVTADSSVAWASSTGLVAARSAGSTSIGVVVDESSAQLPIRVTPRAGITRILDSLRVAYDLPALAGAIVTRDGVWALDAVGVRRYGGATHVTVDDKFHLGSDLKSMTAGLIGILVDEGRLQWTTTLQEIYPELASTMRPEYRTLTIRELLTQQSGLPRDVTVPFSDPTLRQQRESFVRWVVQQPPVSPRGTYFYSNDNFVLAGAIAERVTDQPYEELIRNRLFAPLGMTTVGFGAAGTPGAEDQPWGHVIDPDGTHHPLQSDNPLVGEPAGGAHMSIGDWGRWASAVLRAQAGRSSLWTPATTRMLTTPGVTISGSDAYAMGWIVVNRSWAAPTGRALNHTGSNTMNYANIWVAPDAGFAVLVATNQGGTWLNGTLSLDHVGEATDVAAGRLISLYLQGR